HYSRDGLQHAPGRSFELRNRLQLGRHSGRAADRAKRWSAFRPEYCVYPDKRFAEHLAICVGIGLGGFAERPGAIDRPKWADVVQCLGIQRPERRGNYAVSRQRLRGRFHASRDGRDDLHRRSEFGRYRDRVQRAPEPDRQPKPTDRRRSGARQPYADQPARRAHAGRCRHRRLAVPEDLLHGAFPGGVQQQRHRVGWMIAPRVEQLEKDLRRAAACRQYKEVVRLATEIGGGARGHALDARKGDARAAESARKMYDLLSWALVMMQAARSACVAELRLVTTATRYARPSGATGRTAAVSLDALSFPCDFFVNPLTRHSLDGPFACISLIYLPSQWNSSCLNGSAVIHRLTDSLEQYMNVVSLRQKLVASNIANADTPGYKTQDLDFQSSFLAALDGGSPQMSELTGLPTKNDGNNVDLDREARLLAENAMRFNAASN